MSIVQPRYGGDSVNIEVRKGKLVEALAAANGVLLLDGGDSPFDFLDRGIDIRLKLKRAELVHREGPHLCGGNGRLTPPQLRVVRFDLGDELVQVALKGDALRAEHQLMEILPVLGGYGEPRVDVLIDEGVIEDRDVGQRAVPCRC